MPTYQYRCKSCGEDLEIFQKFTDPALTECPSCSGELRKVFNAVGVVFKGSGFYSTDSRPKKSGAKESESKPSDSKKSDSKPRADAAASTSSTSSTGSSSTKTSEN